MAFKMSLRNAPYNGTMMSRYLHSSGLNLWMLGCLSALSPVASFAATPLPGPADIDRVQPGAQLPDVQMPDASPIVPRQGYTAIPAPEDAKSIRFLLKDVRIVGSTIYSLDELKTFYAADLGKEISLDKAWSIAAAVTDKYRNDGYFLTRAYVPAQEVDGTLTIQVVEGYIGDVLIDQGMGDNFLIRQIISKIKSEKPITVQTLEREHLLLSDIPGLDSYQGILTPMKGADEGAVQLIFRKRDVSEKSAFIGIDNFGSRYLGPYQLSATYKNDFIPFQNTFISATTSVPTKELAAINVTQTIPVHPDWVIEATAGYTRSQPGFDLEPQEIESRAINAGVSVMYKAIRQRQENLSFKFGLDGRNSDSTILDTDLTTDRIRALRLGATYDKVDSWYGYNIASVTLSRGLDTLGASSEDDINLSRSGAYPDFTKLEVSYTRLQGINTDWSALLSISGQKASGSLFSSEEFGFGGQNLGRAYDPSEISGDDGIAAGIELRYQSLPSWQNINFYPYAFYDIGQVWNLNDGQEDTISAASTGLGVRFQHDSGITATLQFSQPLTKEVSTPLYGSNGGNPQIAFQLGYNF